MSIRKLLALLIALAVLAAPGLAGGAMARPMPGAMQMMEGHRCEAPSSSSHHHKMAGKSCCIQMCTGVAIAPASLAIEHDTRHAPPAITIPVLHLAYLGEIATPPPRRD